MIKRFVDWLDDRVGYRHLLHTVLFEAVPGGARWRYVWGSTLVFTFFVQLITGFCLWTAYSPSVEDAWASVFYIQEYVFLGSLIRGVHHFAAQAMVVLLVIHFLQILIDKAYQAPREINFWLGLMMMFIVLGLALSGYLLPWDQKGYYATQVATKIVGAVPLVGATLQDLIQGGDEYGHLTLTRFFALHAGLLPGLLAVLLVCHLALFRRHGLTPAEPLRGTTGVFWPDQVLKDGIACLAVLGVLVALTIFVGAELAAPADPAEAYSAARPEWYFLFLFRFLKFEFIDRLGLAMGAVVVPSIAVAIVALSPLTARLPGGHRFNVLFVSLLVAGAAGLTGLAIYEDRTDEDHQAALAEARRDAQRVRELASRPTRIPVTGAVTLLREDPLTQGPRMYAKHCASCHLYNGHDGRGRIVKELDPETGQAVAALPTAPDLGNLGSRAWMRAIIVDFEGHFQDFKNAPWFGSGEGIDPATSEMADWSGDREALLSAENKDNLNALIEFLVAETQHKDLDVDSDLVERGRKVATEGAWAGGLEGIACTDCHYTMGEEFDPDAGGTGYPDLARYLSAAWLTDFLEDAGAEQHYADRNQMPAYKDKLTEQELALLVRWLTGDYYPSDQDASREGGTTNTPAAEYGTTNTPAAEHGTTKTPAAEAAECISQGREPLVSGHHLALSPGRGDTMTLPHQAHAQSCPAPTPT